MDIYRTTQCQHCPWRKDARLSAIPGYSLELHEALAATMAEGDVAQQLARDTPGALLHLFRCHDSPSGRDTPCVGWLVNQLGPGNNIALRWRLAHAPPPAPLRTVGEQYARFEETLPHNREERRRG